MASAEFGLWGTGPKNVSLHQYCSIDNQNSVTKSWVQDHCQAKFMEGIWQKRKFVTTSHLWDFQTCWAQRPTKNTFLLYNKCGLGPSTPGRRNVTTYISYFRLYMVQSKPTKTTRTQTLKPLIYKNSTGSDSHSNRGLQCSRQGFIFKCDDKLVC